jgi:hypothetical protein
MKFLYFRLERTEVRPTSDCADWSNGLRGLAVGLSLQGLENELALSLARGFDTFKEKTQEKSGK